MPNHLQSQTIKLRPPLKWAGGKRWLIPHLLPLWERHRNKRLVEPFCGGLAVSLGLRPIGALLNDINPHVINFYHWLAKGLVIELPMENDEQLYYSYREKFNSLIRTNKSKSKLAAELFYFLNKTGYNGLCRFNRKGELNVPFGRYNRINYIRDFRHYQQLVSRWTFVDNDFRNLPTSPEDFIYSDPPYDVEFTKYAREDFGWKDQIALATWLTEHPGPVILSNQATDRIVGLYQDLGFSLQFLPGPRRISCTGDRRPAIEVLACRNIQSRQSKNLISNSVPS